MVYQHLIFFILALVLNACGYHLRGSGDVPTVHDSIYLEGGSTQFRGQFNKAIKISNGKLAASAAEAGVVIKIVKEDFRRRILSLSSRGRSNEVELDYYLDYVLNKSEKVLLSGQPIQIRREYFNDQQDIIAKDNEEKVIRSEIYQQAVQNIMNRARVALQEKPK